MHTLFAFRPWVSNKYRYSTTVERARQATFVFNFSLEPECVVATLLAYYPLKKCQNFFPDFVACSIIQCIYYRSKLGNMRLENFEIATLGINLSIYLSESDRFLK